MSTKKHHPNNYMVFSSDPKTDPQKKSERRSEQQESVLAIKMPDAHQAERLEEYLKDGPRDIFSFEVKKNNVIIHFKKLRDTRATAAFILALSACLQRSKFHEHNEKLDFHFEGKEAGSVAVVLSSVGLSHNNSSFSAEQEQDNFIKTRNKANSIAKDSILRTMHALKTNPLKKNN